MKKINFILIIIFCAIIIFNLSINAVYLASNFGNIPLIMDTNISYNNYINSILMNYAINVFIPIIFALYSIYEFKQQRISSIYLFMWMVFNLAAAGYSFYGMIILKIPTVCLYLFNVLILVYISLSKR